MKIRDDMISRMEIDIQSLKEINSSSVYQQYVSLAEHVNLFNGLFFKEFFFDKREEPTSL